MTIFEKPGGNLLTKESLLKIQETEDRIMNLENMDTFCLKSEGKCVKPRSILRLFDGSSNDILQKYIPRFMLDTYVNLDNIEKVLQVISHDPAGREILRQII